MSRVRLSAAELRLLRHLAETAPSHYWLRRYVKPQNFRFMRFKKAVFIVTSGVMAIRALDMSVLTDWLIR